MLQPYFFTCPAGTVFDETVSVCNFPWAAPPCGGPPPPEDDGASDGTSDGTTDGTTDGTSDGTSSDTETETVIVAAPSFSFQCTSEGLFEHDSDCMRFWLCR